MAFLRVNLNNSKDSAVIRGFRQYKCICMYISSPPSFHCKYPLSYIRNSVLPMAE